MQNNSRLTIGITLILIVLIGLGIWFATKKSDVDKCIESGMKAYHSYMRNDNIWAKIEKDVIETPEQAEHRVRLNCMRAMRN
jgi:hypothetical protein